MAALAKARLIELDQEQKEKPGGKKVTVQFNPESLKVTFANQIVQPPVGDQSGGTGGRQYVGTGTTKLALTLWFDATAMSEKPVDDVRRLTGEVIYFMTPQEAREDKDKLIPPGVRFSWGTFLFDGMVDGIEESLEFFAPDGKPLRASIGLSLSQQKILVSKLGKNRARLPTTGENPLSAARAGDNLQSMAGIMGANGGWQGIAAANGIEDPLRLDPGQLIDLDASASVGGSFGASAGASISAGVSPPSPRITLPTASTRFGVN